MTKASGDSPIYWRDALTSDPGERYSVVLANPPFGTTSSTTMVGADGESSKNDLEIVRDDFWVTTSNKQINFLQHIKTIMDTNGRAAVVLPDNVLFEAGKGELVRKRLLNEFDVHTMLRLPTGIFYRTGVKANVLFFDKKPAGDAPWTRNLWVYDLRTNMHFTRKTRPLKRVHLQDFVNSFSAENRSKRAESERFRSFSYNELVSRELTDLDLLWLKDDSVVDASELPTPDEIGEQISVSLEAALDELKSILNELQKRRP